MVYENAWGKTNSYLPDGKVNEASPDVTTETLYDLASLTKMFSVNYALQKLVTDDWISLDADPGGSECQGKAGGHASFHQECTEQI